MALDGKEPKPKGKLAKGLQVILLVTSSGDISTFLPLAKNLEKMYSANVIGGMLQIQLLVVGRWTVDLNVWTWPFNQAHNARQVILCAFCCISVAFLLTDQFSWLSTKFHRLGRSSHLARNPKARMPGPKKFAKLPKLALDSAA